MTIDVWRRVAALTASVSLLLAPACGSDDESTAAPTTTAHDHASHTHTAEDDAALKPKMHPCSLLTAEEAAVVVGPVAKLVENLGDGQAPVPYSRICAVALQSNRFAAHIGFTQQEVERRFAAFEQNFRAAVEPIGSLGDKANWVSIFRLLLVLDGDDLLVVQMLEPTDDLNTARDKAVKLAAAAVPRLPHNTAQ